VGSCPISGAAGCPDVEIDSASKLERPPTPPTFAQARDTLSSTTDPSPKDVFLISKSNIV
jgi:hypothetical protein